MFTGRSDEGGGVGELPAGGGVVGAVPTAGPEVGFAAAAAGVADGAVGLPEQAAVAALVAKTKARVTWNKTTFDMTYSAPVHERGP
jgi:hypothetical protein